MGIDTYVVETGTSRWEIKNLNMQIDTLTIKTDVWIMKNDTSRMEIENLSI